MNKWRHNTWEKGDCVYEGLQLKIGNRYRLVGFWFVCGIDNCPSSTRFGYRKMTDEEVKEEFGCYREQCLQNVRKIVLTNILVKDCEEIDLRVDKCQHS